MTLRIKGNSVRIRLSSEEVDQFRQTGVVTATTTFPDGRTLSYSLEQAEDVDALAVSFDGEKLLVSVPVEWAQEWTSTDKIGIRTDHTIGERSLEVLVEKDLRYLRTARMRGKG